LRFNVSRTQLCLLSAVFLCPGTRAQSEEGTPRISVVIGNLLPEEGAAGKAAPSPFESPFGMDFDAAGNMFVVELEGGRVHKLDAAGKFTTIAGDGSKSYRGDGGPARRATFNGMHNVAVTLAGDVYIADTWNHCIRKIDPKSGIVTTVAGTGKRGYSGDGGPASKATFGHVMCITLNATNDQIYVADLTNRRIRRVDLKTHVVETVVGNGKTGVPRDGDVAVESPLVDPRAVAVDSQNRIYVLERLGHALRVVTTDGKIRTVAGTGKPGDQDGPARAAALKSPKHICVDPDDNVIIADEGNALIRKYDARKRTLTRILGRGLGTPPIRLSQPHGVCIEKGTLYVVDTGHDRILRVK